MFLSNVDTPDYTVSQFLSNHHDKVTINLLISQLNVGID